MATGTLSPVRHNREAFITLQNLYSNGKIGRIFNLSNRKDEIWKTPSRDGRVNPSGRLSGEISGQGNPLCG